MPDYRVDRPHAPPLPAPAWCGVGAANTRASLSRATNVGSAPPAACSHLTYFLLRCAVLRDVAPQPRGTSTVGAFFAPTRAAMSEPKDIGGGWFENLDPSSGRKYYSNATTNETTWEWPQDVPKPYVATPHLKRGSGGGSVSGVRWTRNSALTRACLCCPLCLRACDRTLQGGF